MNNIRRIAVLGAGISGLTAAWKLGELGIQVDLIESASRVGGLAATHWQEGHGIDAGPHTFFTDDREVQALVHNLFPEGLLTLDRKVHFRFRSHQIAYPINPLNLLTRLDPQAAGLIFRDMMISVFARVKRLPSNPTLEMVLRRNFGDYLFAHFFKPYTEQFWNIPASALSPDSMPYDLRAGLLHSVKSLVFSKIHPGDASLQEREKLPMQYPRKGFGQIADRLAEKCQEQGCTLRLNANLTQIRRTSAGKWRLCCGEQNTILDTEYDALISTLPIPVFFQRWQEVVSPEVRRAADHLHYRPLSMLALATTQSQILKGSQYVYFLGRPYNRIFETSQFSPNLNPQGSNLLGIEMPAFPSGYEQRESADNLCKLLVPYLRSDLGLHPAKIQHSFIIKIPNAYPIYYHHYHEHLKTVLNFVMNYPNLTLLGRSGEFRYMDSDRCIRRVLDRIPSFIHQVESGRPAAHAAPRN